MNMGVHYRLSRCRAVVKADVEPIWPKFGNERDMYLSHEVPNRRLFLFGQLEQTGNVPLRDDERVALGHGESVEQRYSELALHPDAGFLQVTEGAILLVHDRIITMQNRGVQVAGPCL